MPQREEGRRCWSLASGNIEGEAVRDQERDCEQEEGRRQRVVV